MKLLKKDLKNGISKKEAFAGFCERGGNPKKGSRYLASVPDKEESKAYSKLNYGLIGIYIAIFFLGFVNILPLLSELNGKALLFVVGFSLIIPAAIVWMLYKQQAFAYLVLCFLLFKGILDSFKSFDQDPIAVYVGVAINLVIMGYAIYLKIKLFPFQNIFNTKKDEDGVFIYEKI